MSVYQNAAAASYIGRLNFTMQIKRNQGTKYKNVRINVLNVIN